MDVGRHPNIDLFTMATVTKLEGDAGNFIATITCNPRYVKADLCTGCGDCTRACPQSTRNEWDLGLGTRKAIYRPYPQAVPSTYVIDINTCLNEPNHFVCERCRRTCKRDAIDHDMKPVSKDLDIGAVIVATGFEEFHPHVMKNYGYGTWQNVMTSLEFERLLNASGPTDGHIIRPSDRKTPKNLVFIQCVGARGEGGRPNCSKYCCMNAVKDALLVKQHQPDIESCTILYTDIRAFGKGFDGFVERTVNEEYIKFVRGRPSKLMEIENDEIEIFVEDTISNKQLRLKSDLVVLSCAGIPRPETIKLANTLGISLNNIGFFAINSAMRPVETSRNGVFICGSAAGPQIIPDCVAQASAAASKASFFVKDDRITEPEKQVPKALPPDDKPRVGVFICNCGANIGRVVKTEELASEIEKLPNVVYSGVELFACADTGQSSIKEKIVSENLNRIVVAACTPRTHEPVFRQACLEAGLNPYLLEMANIRDQCTWVHSKDKGQAFNKSIDLIRMAVARSAKLQPLETTEVETTKHILIIGGGISGMQSALDLNQLGFQVTLIEKSDKLGGRVKDLHSVFPDNDDNTNPAIILVKKIHDSNVKYLLNTEVKNINGYVGNFKVELESKIGVKELAILDIGAIIIAIGAPVYIPDKKWHYGEIPNVITSMELEKLLSDESQNNLINKVKNVVFIQCVGSRGKNGDYSGCSRFCCPTTVKQALELNERNIDSTVLYKDMRMVGRSAEEFYREARNKGILFLRYDSSRSIHLKGEKTVKSIFYQDSLLNKTIEVPTDLVVLAVGMVNKIEHSEILRQMVKIPRGEDGFFLERHPELGPVETCIDGVFICGTIQSPKDISDSLTQASAAAEKAAELLNKDKLYIEPVVCEVDQKLCRQCGTCIDICEYHAPEFESSNDSEQIVTINKALCKGCGTCAVWCPTNSISAKHFTDEQINSMITALFEDYHV